MRQQDETDYIMEDGTDTVWITVNNVSVHVVRKEDGVSVKLYPLKQEMNDCIGETFLTWEEAKAKGGEDDRV